jgi:hypothetical protein
MTTQVALASICVDGGTQTRARLDRRYVDELARLYGEGMALPDLVVYYDGIKYWLADGFHRHAAATKASLQEINADIREGNKRDALLYAAGANTTHGLRRTNKDKRNAVRLLLSDPEWWKAADRWIADTCRVSNHLVAAVRAEHPGGNSPTSTQQTGSDNLGQPAETRTGRDGKTYSSRASQPMCARCRRVGTVQGCKRCKAAQDTKNGQAERQPGDDTDSIADERRRRRSNGKPKYDWKSWDKTYGILLRSIKDIDEAYGVSEASEEGKRARSLLAEVLTVVRDWKARLLGGK